MGLYIKHLGNNRYYLNAYQWDSRHVESDTQLYNVFLELVRNDPELFKEKISYEKVPKDVSGLVKKLLDLSLKT